MSIKKIRVNGTDYDISLPNSFNILVNGENTSFDGETSANVSILSTEIITLQYESIPAEEYAELENVSVSHTFNEIYALLMKGTPIVLGAQTPSTGLICSNVFLDGLRNEISFNTIITGFISSSSSPIMLSLAFINKSDGTWWCAGKAL